MTKIAAKKKETAIVLAVPFIVIIAFIMH